MRRRRAALAACVALLAGAGQALAHAHLLHSDPAAGARLGRPPKALALTFSEPLAGAFSSLELKSGDGKLVPLGPSRVVDARTLLAVPKAPLPPGGYVLLWRAVSTDTHRTSGEVDFTIAAP